MTLQARSVDRVLPDGFVARLATVLDPAGLITDPSDRASYLIEERSLFESRAEVVVAPKTAEELAATVRLCAEAGVPLVPQGGATGLVGGAVAGTGDVLVSLKRMNRILDVDPVNFTISAEAGCVLADLQEAAREAGCLFPLSLGAEGSCTIGGNIASNAGGVGVLRYGNTRELTLGLEVVLPDGRIWNGMRPLYKDNSGYSLKNLFIGSEGTLGIVTAAVMKLFPQPQQRETAFCALGSVEDALALLSLARRLSGDGVSAFELMSDFSLDIVCKHTEGRRPYDTQAPWHALIELTTSRPGDDLRRCFESILEAAFEQGLVLDGVVAESEDQAGRLWQLREATPEAQKRAGGSIKHDVSVPVSRIPEFIATASAAVMERMPGVHVCAFGHVGDGNVHYNLTQPDDMDKAAFLARWGEMNAIVHEVVRTIGGSISAEHGVGLLKLQELADFRSDVENDLMRSLKRALDPDNRMNAGKLVAI
ncbi:FAD-binding oxidoreductase [Amorphus sp. 3PC139-8]|uniref:FAD-binding oxidoreductase n=1 Tax=Amorphus sp. 3PC139-8 TaxID=2735676 RepID=UPI00345DD454